MPRISNANPTLHSHSFHEHAARAADKDLYRLDRTKSFAGDCFVLPLKMARQRDCILFGGGIFVAPFSTTLGIATCLAIPPLYAKLGIDVLAENLSK